MTPRLVKCLAQIALVALVAVVMSIAVIVIGYAISVRLDNRSSQAFGQPMPLLRAPALATEPSVTPDADRYYPYPLSRQDWLNEWTPKRTSLASDDRVCAQRATNDWACLGTDWVKTIGWTRKSSDVTVSQEVCASSLDGLLRCLSPAEIRIYGSENPPPRPDRSDALQPHR